MQSAQQDHHWTMVANQGLERLLLLKISVGENIITDKSFSDCVLEGLDLREMPLEYSGLVQS